MILHELRVKNFRKFDELTLDFIPGMNAFVGKNGTGKTSLIEALFLFVSTKSFRTSKLDHLIKKEASLAEVEIDWTCLQIPQKLAFSLSQEKKEIYYNLTKLPTLSSLIGKIIGITITPEDGEIIRGSAKNRRSFLDLFLSQADPLYLWHSKRYANGLKIKNQLLKIKQLDKIPFYEKEMAISGSYVQNERSKVLDLMTPLTKTIYSTLAGTETSLELSCSTYSPEEIVERWEKERFKETQFGLTQSGPHKEEITLRIDDKEARFFGSEGEKKSFLISLKLAQWHILKKRSSGVFPLLFIDDLEAHLDKKRQNAFLEILQDKGQVFLTSCSSKNLPGKIQIIE